MTELTDLNDTDALNTAVTGNSTEGNVANMGNMDNLQQAILGMLSRFRNANIFRLRDNTDKTKLLAFDLSGLTTATTRTVTVGDENISLYNQGWKRIGKTTVSGSAVAAISFTGIGGYRAYRGRGFIVPSVDGPALRAQASADNGATWLNGAAENSVVSHRATASADTFDSETTTSLAAAGLNTGIGNVDTSEGVFFEFSLGEFNQARNTRYMAENNYLTTAGGLVSERVVGSVLNASPHNAFRWFCGTGDITVGSWIELEGLV